MGDDKFGPYVGRPSIKKVRRLLQGLSDEQLHISQLKTRFP
jgi:hypothetical protein